jgi:hypothetical protein
VRDVPRLLARNSTREHAVLGVGYTDELDRALRDEPEAVPADYQALLIARAHRTARDRQLDEWTRPMCPSRCACCAGSSRGEALGVQPVDLALDRGAAHREAQQAAPQRVRLPGPA